MPGTGPLTARQRDYVDHIGSSSSVLLTIVNDILDLATVDAGIMELEIGEVDVDRAVTRRRGDRCRAAAGSMRSSSTSTSRARRRASTVTSIACARCCATFSSTLPIMRRPAARVALICERVEAKGAVLGP